MKKIFLSVLVLILLFNLCSCKLLYEKIKCQTKDKNGEDDYSLAVFGEEEIKKKNNDCYCFLYFLNTEGEKSYENEDYMQDADIVNATAQSELSGVSLLMASYGKTDTIKFSVEANRKCGNMRVVLLDEDYEIIHDFDIENESSVEISDAKGKQFQIRVAGEASRFEVKATREFIEEIETDYTDEKLEESNNQSNDNLEAAKSYADEKFEDANNHSNANLEAAKSYTDEKFDEINQKSAEYFNDEITATVNSIRSACTSKAFVFAVVTDTHYTGDNNWKNTIKNIKAVNEKYKLDAIFHLGDMVNGNLAKSETIELLEEMRNSMIGLGIPVFTLIGNHDDNTQYQNTTERITNAELYSILGRYNDINVVREDNKNYFYFDLESFNIRVICLHSHLGDNTSSEGSSWGYPAEEVEWLEKVALNTDKQVLFFSHQSFTKEFNAYNAIYGENILDVVENFKANGGTVVGLFHGHTHWDNIAKKNTIYEISTGCSIAEEATPTYKPESATIPSRTVGTVTEDLWDVVVVQPTEKKVKIIRFGAGEDREFSY